MLLRCLVPAAFALAVSIPARADHHILYECVDASGNKQFTNVTPKDKTACKVLHVAPLNNAPASPATPAAPRAGSKAAPAPSPANFPRVDRETQQSRDGQRRRILEQELTNEQKLLEQAKRDLAE